MNSDTNLLSNIKALSEHCELVEAEVEVQVRQVFSDALHEPARAARGETVRFKAEGIHASTAVFLALVIVCLVSNDALDLTFGDVRGASGAHDGDVEGDRASFREVVDGDVARSPVRASNRTRLFIFDHDAGGFENGGEGVFDVVVALMGEA